MITFEQWWKEYCVKHHLDIGSPLEKALRQVAVDAWNEGQTDIIAYLRSNKLEGL